MVCSGASELSMAQWASAYAEAALGLSKTMEIFWDHVYLLSPWESAEYYMENTEKK